MAAESPTACAIFGTPASNFLGAFAQVALSIVTESTIEPPKSAGSIFSKISDLPQRIPIPVGPNVL